MNLKALYKLGYGLYVVSSRKGDRLNGQIANTVFQITSEPPIIAVSINKNNLTHEFIKESKVLTVSVLSQDTALSFIGHFGFKSGREVDKLEGINYKVGETQAPVVADNALAYLEAKVIQEIDVGTHTIFVGELVGADIIKEGEPMTYAYYHQVKRGTTPRTAPSYIEEKREAVVKKISDIKSPDELATYDGYIFGSPTYSLDEPEPMKTFLLVVGRAGLEGKLGSAFGSYTHDVSYKHDAYAPAIIFNTLQDVCKMEPFELGPFNLKEEVVETSEGMKASHDYGRVFGEKLGS